MASSNKITLERIDHDVLPKKKNRIHGRGTEFAELFSNSASAPRW